MRQHLFRMHEAVLRSAPIRPGDRILYVGSNSAALTTVTADRLAKTGELVGIDFTFATLHRAERLLEASENKNMLFFRLAQPAIPFPDNYFDLVIVFGAFERLPHGEQVLGELCRVVRPDGKVYWHDVSTSLEGFREKLVQALFFGRKPTKAQQALNELRKKMSAFFAIEFSRRWTHTWGKQSCLLVGKKTFE
jgi:ubiquinone/menaquinone biosynthesis C-methylase UbiE